MASRPARVKSTSYASRRALPVLVSTGSPRARRAAVAGTAKPARPAKRDGAVSKPKAKSAAAERPTPVKRVLAASNMATAAKTTSALAKSSSASVKKSAAKRATSKAAAKSGKAAAKTPAGKGQTKSAGSRKAPEKGDRIAQLEAQLAAANERIADLEARQTDVLNRIEWILEGLQGLLELTERPAARARTSARKKRA